MSGTAPHSTLSRIECGAVPISANILAQATQPTFGAHAGVERGRIKPDGHYYFTPGSTKSVN